MRHAFFLKWKMALPQFEKMRDLLARVWGGALTMLFRVWSLSVLPAGAPKKAEAAPKKVCPVALLALHQSHSL